MTDFTGCTILVTGAAGGIGGEALRHLVAAGADVIAAGETAESLEGIVAETGARPLAFDLRDADAIRDALEGVEVDGLVNCAGWGGVVAPLTETEADVFDGVMSINTRGALLVTKFVARGMIERGRGGSIVNVSSQASLVALEGHAAYAASKAALDAVTRVAALELGVHGIRVNSVNPTVVMTPMSAGYWGRSDIGEPFLAKMPLNRWATEADIAGPILFLLSDQARMVTGITLPVDGGYSAT